ncbi:MAG: hypothetical protein JO051_06385 [Acidobacteriaceae bacterium]|nr:hypothetical protein [Acidobacteriaceae bacterium]
MSERREILEAQLAIVREIMKETFDEMSEATRLDEDGCQPQWWLDIERIETRLEFELNPPEGKRDE